MPKFTNEDKQKFKNKLEYIGLDLDNLPEFLKKFEQLDYRANNVYNDKEFVIYKTIPITDIQILITNINKQENIQKRYLNSKSLYSYLSLNIDEPDNIEKYTAILNMINDVSIDEIKSVEKKQKIFEQNIPFGIKYNKNYMWEIYHSDATNKYFMMVSVQDTEFCYFFYLLKKQIEYYSGKLKTVPTIYVPITDEEYSNTFFNKSEIKDIENYLWLFTENWPTVYEVYDKDNNLQINIIGETFVYEKIKTKYKMTFNTKEAAFNFYKQLKALFVLQTETLNHYKFECKINDNSELEFYFNNSVLLFENISDFIKVEYLKTKDNIIRTNLSNKKLEKKLEKNKLHAKEKETEFLDKQKQIATYLEYKKTFFGKLKYFFKAKKKLKKEISNEEEKLNIDDTQSESYKLVDQEKSVYTIEDLVILYATYDNVLKHFKNLNLDLDALENKIKNLSSKLNNATLYIQEIDNHKKSIFEFWKFANKDETLTLNPGTEQVQISKKIKKVFDYEEDIEELGIKMDKAQRELLDKETTDNIFLTTTDFLQTINILKRQFENNKYLENDKQKLQQSLNYYKELLENNVKTIDINDIDIFGNLLNDRTKIKHIANKTHRESEKNELQILKNVLFNCNNLNEFISKIEQIIKNLNDSLSKVTSLYNMPIYAGYFEEQFEKTGFQVFNMNILNAVKKFENTNNKDIVLCKLNICENMPLLYYTNIMFFDNYNKTLPLGMNLSDCVLIDANKYNFILKNKYTFKTNDFTNKTEDIHIFNTQNVTVFEYDLTIKN